MVETEVEEVTKSLRYGNGVDHQVRNMKVNTT